MRIVLHWIIVPSLLFISGCSSKSNQTNSNTAHNEQISQFVIKDIDQRKTKVKIEKHRLTIERVLQPIVIIHLFSTKNSISEVMLPYLNYLQQQFPKKVFVLGIIVPEDMDDNSLRNYMLKKHLSFFISDSKDNKTLAYRLADLLQLDDNYPLPLTIVFRNGKLIRYYAGITPIEMIYSDLHRIDPAIKRKR